MIFRWMDEPSPIAGGDRLITPQIRHKWSTADWWPMFHHDLAHIGYSTSTAKDKPDSMELYN
jgi:hypothetical protein